MTCKTVYSFLIIFLVSPTLLAQSNEGTEFWFGFMQHIDQGTNNMAVIITSKHNTSASLKVPALGFNRDFNVIGGDVTIINLPNQAENLGSEQIQNKGIQVVSVDPVSVYIHQYSNMRSEASLVLPNTSLGNQYFVMSYPGVSFNNASTLSEFLIIATENNTNVRISLSDGTQGGKSAGSEFNVRLNKGQTYQVQAASSDGDLTGTEINSDQKISVIAGSEWSQVPVGCTFMDNLMEQMYPVGTWGKKYITVPTSFTPYDVYRVISSSDNTAIQVLESGISSNYVLNKGEFVEFDLRFPAVIEASDPILLAQYNIGSTCSGHAVGDPSMLLINSVEQSRDTVTLYNSAFESITENYITAVINTDDIGITTFDSEPIMDAAFESAMIGDGSFSYFIMSVATGAHTIISPGCGVIASAYGYGPIESYSYGGGANFRNVNENPIPEGGCLNDTLFFDSGLSPFRYDVQWNFGDGEGSNGSKASHIYRSLDTFRVTMTFFDKCLIVSDSRVRDVVITLREEVQSPDSLWVCENQSIELSASDVPQASYLWNGPNDFRSENQFPLLENVQLIEGGNYEVIGVVSGCATFPAELNLRISPAPIPIIESDTIFCSRDRSLFLDPGVFSSYQWSNGAMDQMLEVTSEGLFSITVTDELGCPGINQLFINDICPSEIYIPNIFTPNEDGQNDEFKVIGFRVDAYQISIYDRWGDQVFNSSDISEHWNGRKNGVNVVTGVYTYIIEYTGNDHLGNPKTNTLHGNVTLIK